jgi:hypothetical protein
MANKTLNLQYMYNTININPAYAGSRCFGIFALHRQWVGLDGAPVTNAVSVNTPLTTTGVRSWCVCY